MERGDRASLATFFVPEALRDGARVDLDGGVAQHARVRRVQVGEHVRLTNGAGTTATALVEQIAKRGIQVVVQEASYADPPPHLALLAPVADRDRMLWLAEKCAELAVSVWQPVVFRRSSSVSPRGEGEAFRRKVQARMIGALEQSGGAWLPEIHAEIPLAQALVSRQGDDVHRLLLDSGGARLVRADVRGAVDLLLGPEGGIDMSELDLLTRDHGWVPVSLAETTLRFETAGVVAVGIVRSRLGPA